MKPIENEYGGDLFRNRLEAKWPVTLGLEKAYTAVMQERFESR